MMGPQLKSNMYSRKKCPNSHGNPNDKNPHWALTCELMRTEWHKCGKEVAVAEIDGMAQQLRVQNRPEQGGEMVGGESTAGQWAVSDLRPPPGIVSGKLHEYDPDPLRVNQNAPSPRGISQW